ncbi:nmrA-like family domain-containing protein 1 isoform X2 [Amia ocellicauda]|uniref:nmrA-like family domain-containing protein 1 isoform X2 n=1 Tax=Amia ocellicauda TaxID=2972642 RepID=UPI0034642E7A
MPQHLSLLDRTGAQGGSVARALLKDPAFAVRAVTRDTTKPAAVELAGLGAQLVKVDLASQAEVEAALKGVYGTFLVTNFWEHFDKSKEVQQGKMVADLAKKLGLKHVVYSGLENVNRITGGKLTVLHFDGKGEVEEYFRTISVPMTSVRLPFYFENFISFFKPTKTGPDTYSVGLPMGDVPMDGMSVADLGPVVLSILKSREEFVGKDIGLSADRLTVVQYSEVMTRCLGKTFTDGKIPVEVYEKLDFSGAKEMANMFRFYHMNPDRDLALTRRLNPQVQSLEQWLKKNADAFKDL